MKRSRCMSSGFFGFMKKLKQFFWAVVNNEYLYQPQIRFRPIEFYVERSGQWISLNFRLLPLNSWFYIEIPPPRLDILDDEIPF